MKNLISQGCARQKHFESFIKKVQSERRQRLAESRSAAEVSDTVEIDVDALIEEEELILKEQAEWEAIAEQTQADNHESEVEQAMRQLRMLALEGPDWISDCSPIDEVFWAEVDKVLVTAEGGSEAAARAMHF